MNRQQRLFFQSKRRKFCVRLCSFPSSIRKTCKVSVPRFLLQPSLALWKQLEVDQHNCRTLVCSFSCGKTKKMSNIESLIQIDCVETWSWTPNVAPKDKHSVNQQTCKRAFKCTLTSTVVIGRTTQILYEVHGQTIWRKKVNKYSIKSVHSCIIHTIIFGIRDVQQVISPNFCFESSYTLLLRYRF